MRGFGKIVHQKLFPTVGRKQLLQKKRKKGKGIHSNSSTVASKKVTVLFFSTKCYFIRGFWHDGGYLTMPN